MKRLPLPNDKFALVDDDVFEFAGQWRWTVNKGGYVCRCARGGDTPSGQYTMLLHRAVMGVEKGMECDHRDGDKLNNQRENLRVSTRSQNMLNIGSRKGSASQYCGVGPSGTKWKAGIRLNYKYKHLGVYTTEEAAARAYDYAAHTASPEFAKLNFDDGIWDAEKINSFRATQPHSKTILT